MSKSEKEFYKELGQKLHGQRKRFKRSQASLAELLGITQGTYCRIEHGKLTLSIYQFKILETLGFKL